MIKVNERTKRRKQNKTKQTKKTNKVKKETNKNTNTIYLGWWDKK